MDIKKLGLASTAAILSTTIFLGGCDLIGKTKTDAEKAKQAAEEARKKDIGGGT
ncbi:small effector proten [Candidatus Liberibacter solanacearum]|uniref:small effector proten n=1 Tax=Candidatus Liberibacter solanacearum TaxID=556287 RepID=UPI001570A033|nr:small effector proten [Candidatus Liberibacter solanacearum]